MKGRLVALLAGMGCALLLLAAFAGPLEAALGEPPGPVASDQAALQAKRVSQRIEKGYSIRELQADAVSLREYIDPDGIVFAIAWDGLIHPELPPLLGSYAGEYEKAEGHTPRRQGLRQRKIQSDRVVVETWGHMRNLQGRAYAPALIPSGVTIDEIK